jgi:hypothetical protein
MFGTITAATAAAAPHVIPVAVAGTKAVAGFAVALKATRYAKAQVDKVVVHTDEAILEAQEAIAEDRIDNEHRDLNVA